MTMSHSSASSRRSRTSRMWFVASPSSTPRDSARCFMAMVRARRASAICCPAHGLRNMPSRYPDERLVSRNPDAALVGAQLFPFCRHLVSAHPLAAAFDVEDAGAVLRPVDDGGGYDGVGADLAPVAEATVGGQDHGEALRWRQMCGLHASGRSSGVLPVRPVMEAALPHGEPFVNCAP